MTTKSTQEEYWRPEGWENPYERPDAPYLTEKHIIAAMSEPKSNYELYEAGADAMLDKIRRQAVILEEDALRCASS